MWYLVQKNADESYSVLGKAHKPFATRSNQENTFDSVDREPETTRVVLDENDQPIRDVNGNMSLEDDPNKIAEKALEEEIAVRVKRIQFGQRLIALMSIRNDTKNLTGAQIVQLVADFADINTAWLNGSISTSRALVDAITPDGTLITSADKTAILAEIDANLERLGY